MRTQGPRTYFDTGDLSTLEYLYDLRWMRASSEMHSAIAFSVVEQLVLAPVHGILDKTRQEEGKGTDSDWVP